MGNASLGTGVYTLQEASRLLTVPVSKLRGWVAGYPGTAAEPIITTEHEVLDNHVALSFINLMEARFIDAFSKYGVHVRSIRLMAAEAKRVLNHSHPFATDFLFRTDGRKIFIEVAEETGDKKLYDLRGKNWAFHGLLAAALKEGVVFGESGVARAWHPRPRITPNVVVDPRFAFGQPILEQSATPTRALLDAFHAEGESYEMVANWYQLPVEQVRQAIEFEFQLALAA